MSISELAALDWPEDQWFLAIDDPVTGCPTVVMPDGASLSLDQSGLSLGDARAQFIVAACNAILRAKRMGAL
jgi:hypothetical protein